MKKDKHFQTGYFFEYLLIIFGIAILIFLVLHPKPKLYLASLGSFGEVLLVLHQNHYQRLYNVLVGLALIHIVEMLYCIKLAVGLNMTGSTILKWTVQTSVLGVPSLWRLINYKNLSKTDKSS